jgi:hypothetical protein
VLCSCGYEREGSLVVRKAELTCLLKSCLEGLEVSWRLAGVTGLRVANEVVGGVLYFTRQLLNKDEVFTFPSNERCR